MPLIKRGCVFFSPRDPFSRYVWFHFFFFAFSFGVTWQQTNCWHDAAARFFFLFFFFTRFISSPAGPPLSPSLPLSLSLFLPPIFSLNENRWGVDRMITPPRFFLFLKRVGSWFSRLFKVYSVNHSACVCVWVCDGQALLNAAYMFSARSHQVPWLRGCNNLISPLSFSLPPSSFVNWWHPWQILKGCSFSSSSPLTCQMLNVTGRKSFSDPSAGLGQVDVTEPGSFKSQSSHFLWLTHCFPVQEALLGGQLHGLLMFFPSGWTLRSSVATLRPV